MTGVQTCALPICPLSFVRRLAYRPFDSLVKYIIVNVPFVRQDEPEPILAWAVFVRNDENYPIWLSAGFSPCSANCAGANDWEPNAAQ